MYKLLYYFIHLALVHQHVGFGMGSVFNYLLFQLAHECRINNLLVQHWNSVRKSREFSFSCLVHSLLLSLSLDRRVNYFFVLGYFCFFILLFIFSTTALTTMRKYKAAINFHTMILNLWVLNKC